MATITFDPPDKSKILTTSITASYSTSGWSLPTSSTTVKYSGLAYSWSFSPGGGTSTSASGSITITGLTAGSSAIIKATLTVSYIKSTYDSEGNLLSSVKEYPNNSPMSKQYTVYTKPESFSWNFTSEIIQDSGGLTAAKYNNFVTWLGKAMSWSTQTSKSYSHSVSSGDVIYASDYNFLADIVGASNVKGNTITTTNDNYGNGTLITKELFETLVAKALE